MRRLLLSLAMLCTCMGMMAERTIKGTIKDSNGDPVVGANVVIKGTTKGVSADFDGNYSISVENGDVLEFTSMGFQPKTLKITDKVKGVTNITMADDSQVLGEIIVETGYGQQRLKDKTGAGTHLDAEKLRETKVVSIDQALAGHSSGVQVNASSGQPGAKSNVRVRGTSTLTGNSQPLYVVDGLPIGGGKRGTDDNPLASINPEDIETMEVLKDASATAIYGSRAANGVIMITTKRGASEDKGAKVSYSGSFSVSSVSDKLDLMDLQQYSSFYSNPDIVKAFKISSADKELKAAAAIGGKGTDWQDEIFRTAISHQHQIGVTGGNKETQYAYSLGYMKQNGVIINTDFQRFNGRVNLDNQTKKWLRTGISLAYTRIDQTKQAGFELGDDNTLGGLGVGGATDEELYVQSLISKPTTAPTDFDGEYAELGGKDQEIKSNPVRDANYSPINVTKNNIIGNVYAKIDFTDFLFWRNDFGVDHSNTEESRFTPTKSGAANQQEFVDRDNNYWRFSSTLNYSGKTPFEVDSTKFHRYDAMLGFEAWKANWSGKETKKSDYLDDKTFINPDYQNPALGTPVDIDGYKGAQAMMSAFARVNYNYADRYLITATGRFDGSSTLAPDNRWGFFPSFAFAWRVSEEKFMKKYNAKENLKATIDDLKIRLGYGQTGNAGSDAGYISTYAQRNGAFTNGLVQGTWVNSDLIWETNWQINGGIDYTMFHNRLSLIFDVFYKQNNDLIVKAEPGVTLASRSDSWLYTAVPNINAGSMKNVGFDLSIATTNIKKDLGGNEFKWNTDLNFSLVRNEVLELQSDSLPLTDDTYFRASHRSYCRSEVGHAPGLFYGYKTDGIIQNTTQLNSLNRFDGTDVGDYNYVDINSDGKIDVNDKTFIGDPNPDFTFGMGNTLSWGPWALNIFIAGSYGNDVYNLLRSKIESMDRFGVNQLTSVLDYARVITNEDGTKYVENSNTNMPRPNSSANGGEDAQTISDRYVEDGSFLRIQNIGLSYNLPKAALDKIKLSNMRVSFNVQNIATFTKYSGMNPEVANNSAIAQGIDLGGYPVPRQYVIGLNFEF